MLAEHPLVAVRLLGVTYRALTWVASTIEPLDAASTTASRYARKAMSDLRVVPQTGTGYDLLLSAPLLGDRTSLSRTDVARGIRARAARIDGGQLIRRFERFGRDPWISLLGFVRANVPDPTSEATLEAIRTADPRELVLAAIGYNRRVFREVTPPEVILAAVDGDAAAVAEMRRTSFPDIRVWRTSLDTLLGGDPATVRDELFAVLARWHDAAFTELEPEIAERQEAGAGEARRLLETLTFDEVLERIAPRMTFARDIEQTTVVLVPSTMVRPGFALTDHGPTLVIAYPGPDRPVAPGQPPAWLVRMGQALGDELRLRALRELASGGLTVSELARRLGVPRTTLQHHLSLLIGAGYVRLSVDDAQWGRLELRREAIEDIGRAFEAWALHGAADEGDRPGR
jgi:DNA-binding transcriptional ArsR family regulator